MSEFLHNMSTDDKLKAARKVAADNGLTKGYIMVCTNPKCTLRIVSATKRKDKICPACDAKRMKPLEEKI